MPVKQMITKILVKSLTSQIFHFILPKLLDEIFHRGRTVFIYFYESLLFYNLLLADVDRVDRSGVAS